MRGPRGDLVTRLRLLGARATCPDEAAPISGPHDALRLVERGAEAVNALLDAVPRVTSLRDEAESLAARAGEVLDRLEGTRAAADEVVTEAVQTLTRTDGVRTLTRADGAVAAEVDALVSLVETCHLVERLEGEMLPIVRSLETVAPDIHDLLDLYRALNEMLGAVPGLGRVKKRIDEDQEEEDERTTTDSRPATAGRHPASPADAVD